MASSNEAAPQFKKPATPIAITVNSMPGTMNHPRHRENQTARHHAPSSISPGTKLIHKIEAESDVFGSQYQSSSAPPSSSAIANIKTIGIVTRRRLKSAVGDGFLSDSDRKEASNT